MAYQFAGHGQRQSPVDAGLNENMPHHVGVDPAPENAQPGIGKSQLHGAATDREYTVVLQDSVALYVVVELNAQVRV